MALEYGIFGHLFLFFFQTLMLIPLISFSNYGNIMNVLFGEYNPCAIMLSVVRINFRSYKKYLMRQKGFTESHAISQQVNLL